MSYNFSNRVQGVKPSAIREILKATQTPGMISFSAGNPATSTFPVEKIRNITAEILQLTPNVALQYSVSEGLPVLREAITKMLESAEPGFVRKNDACLVLSGAQQGIDFAAKVFLNEGDVVICENPTFVSAINSFKGYGAKLVGVTMESDGMSIAGLEKAIAENKNIKLLYIISNFQNPTGYTTSAEKRKKIYDLCAKNGIMILEDNPYGELRYSGERVASIKSLDSESVKPTVIYIGSFSKVIAPGLRVGYMIADTEIMDKLVVAKQCSDVHTAVLPQMICEKLISSADFSQHITNLRKIYTNKLDLMCQLIEQHIGDKLTYVKPQGGLFLWCKVPSGVSVDELCAVCIKHKVAVVPGKAFSVGAENEYIRLNFSTPSDDEMKEGIPRLAKAIAEFV